MFVYKVLLFRKVPPAQNVIMCFLKSKSRAYVLDSVLVAVKIELIGKMCILPKILYLFTVSLVQPTKKWFTS